jgi:hypothetical protein
MHHIATISGTGAAGSFNFTSIPQTYTHLQLRIYARSFTNSNTLFQYFNNDAAATNYSQHYIMGDGGTVYSGAAINQPYLQTDFITQSGDTANAHGVAIIDILDYRNTSKNKTIRGVGGWDLNGSGRNWMWSGVWRSTAAINAYQITPGFSTASSADLYGITDNPIASGSGA